MGQEDLAAAQSEVVVTLVAVDQLEIVEILVVVELAAPQP